MKRGKKGSGQNKNDSHESNASVTPSIKVAARAGKSKSSFNAQVISASQDNVMDSSVDSLLDLSDPFSVKRQDANKRTGESEAQTTSETTTQADMGTLDSSVDPFLELSNLFSRKVAEARIRKTTRAPFVAMHEKDFGIVITKHEAEIKNQLVLLASATTELSKLQIRGNIIQLREDLEEIHQAQEMLLRKKEIDSRGYIRRWWDLLTSWIFDLCSAILDILKLLKFSETVEIKFQQDGEFLELLAVPDQIRLRSRVQRFLYIRECYPLLLDDITKSLPRTDNRTVAVLGTAGIGKSTFLLYCIYRLQDNPAHFRVATRSFYFQEEEDEVWLYKYLGEGSYSVRKARGKLDKTIPLFVDMQKAELPRDFDGVCIIFTSFREERFKERTKGGWKKVMPIWSTEEQRKLFDSVRFRDLYGEVIAAMAFHNIYYYGGTLRHNITCARDFSDPTTDIANELRRKGKDICSRYMGAGFGGTENDICDMLIHREPRTVDGEISDFNSRSMEYLFASPFVMRAILQHNSQNMAMSARAKFREGTFRGGADGIEFEMLCLHVFKVNGVKFQALPLCAGCKGFDIIFPAKEVLVLNWKECDDYLKTDVLYIPPYGNLESGDAFCLIQLNKRWTLIILQCTIAETHAVKENGMKVIHDCFATKSHLPVEETILVFMIPQNGKLKVAQRITTQDGNDLQRHLAGFRVEKQYRIQNRLADIEAFM